MLRSRCCQRNYCQLKNAVIVLQRRVRANIAAKNERKTSLETKRVTVKLQSSYRGRKVRCLVRKLKAVILIQRWFRAISAGMKVRAGYYRIREAALVIQAAFRGYHGRVIARKMRAARMIQSAIRGFLTRKMIEVRIAFDAMFVFRNYFKIKQRKYKNSKLTSPNFFSSAPKDWTSCPVKTFHIDSLPSFERHQNPAVLPQSTRHSSCKSPYGCCTSYPGKF